MLCIVGVQLADLNRGLSLGGSTVQNFVGVIFTYEFYPVSMSLLYCSYCTTIVTFLLDMVLNTAM
mgnify:CR=1 FL=1|jgi:hypothetical protein